MNGDRLESVLGLLEDGVESANGQYHGPESETALVVSCSMGRCEHGETLWPVEPSWNVVDVPTLGNQTCERDEGETILDGELAHLVSEHDVATVIVVGHTACAVLEDAYDRAIAATAGSPAGIDLRLSPLVSAAEAAFETGVLDESMSLRRAHARFVEFNVVRQIAFLRAALPDSTTTAGYVYDEDGFYRSFPGSHYLVSLDGETEPAAIQTRLPDGPPPRVSSILS